MFGTVSPTLARMLADREAEMERLERLLSASVPQRSSVVPHPILVRRYEQKVSKLREAPNDDLVKADAISALRTLIGSVTIHKDEDGQVEIEVEASTAELIEFAQNADGSQPGGGGRSGMVVAGTGVNRRRTDCSMAVVAGARYDRCRTRVVLTGSRRPQRRFASP